VRGEQKDLLLNIPLPFKHSAGLTGKNTVQSATDWKKAKCLEFAEIGETLGIGGQGNNISGLRPDPKWPGGTPLPKRKENPIKNMDRITHWINGELEKKPQRRSEC